MTPDVLERFESKYIPEPNSGCWLWEASVAQSGGYGYLNVGGTCARAHVLSYEHFVGPVPEGYFVCHTCDVPSCVNPNHLFVGTVYDNNRDCYNKGRYARGERHGGAKLSDKQALEIYRLLQEDREGREIAKIYGVSEQLVSHIKNGHRRVYLRDEFKE